MYYRIIFLILFSSSFCLHADISVSPIIVDLVSKKADAEIAVRNFDSQREAYVEVTAYRVKDPASHREVKVRVRHPEKDGLVIFPAKLVLLPGQTQFVRIVKTTKNYRTIRFMRWILSQRFPRIWSAKNTLMALCSGFE